MKEIFCDGMGACLDVCPVGALKVIEKDSAEYDAKAAYEHVLKTRGSDAAKHVHGAEKVHPAPSFYQGCPGSMAREISTKGGSASGGKRPPVSSQEGAKGSVQSELSQWPIQLHLISPQAPYFNGCDLLVAADCTAFTIGSFHQDLLKGKKVVIACPKLDETDGYVENLAELLKNNTVYSLTVVIMEVPCCSGLFRIVQDAVELSGRLGNQASLADSQAGTKLPVKKIVIGLDGSIRN